MLSDIYSDLLADAYAKGHTSHKSAILYIDKDTTFKINMFNSKELLLDSNYQNEVNNQIYRNYFHLMIVIQFQYDLLFENVNLELSKTSYYYSLKCGVLGFSNRNLYSDIDKYCNILKPKIWLNLNG